MQVQIHNIGNVCFFSVWEDRELFSLHNILSWCLGYATLYYHQLNHFVFHDVAASLQTNICAKVY